MIAPAPVEGSAWLRSQVARRVRQITAAGHDVAGPVLIMTPLGEPTGPDSAEDTTCDRCRAHHPDGLWCAIVVAAPSLHLVLGLCDTCYRLEVPA